MSAIPINSGVNLIEERQSICKKISKIMEKDNMAYYRVKLILENLGVHFLEEVPTISLKMILKLEEAYVNGNFDKVLSEEKIRVGII